MTRIFTALLVFFMALPATARADKCQDAILEVDDFLKSQKTSCVEDDECGGYYFRPAPCEAAVILPKTTITNSFTLELVKLQNTARTACKDKWQDAPVCSSIPAKPVCRDGKCADEARENTLP